MKNGEEFDCIPDSLVYDDDDSEIMAVRELPSERMRLLPENEIEMCRTKTKKGEIKKEKKEIA